MRLAIASLSPPRVQLGEVLHHERIGIERGERREIGFAPGSQDEALGLHGSTITRSETPGETPVAMAGASSPVATASASSNCNDYTTVSTMLFDDAMPSWIDRFFFGAGSFQCDQSVAAYCLQR